MVRTRFASYVVVAAAVIALSLPTSAGAGVVATGTLDLKGGICLTATHCLLVGDDGVNRGAIVPLSEVDSQAKAPACESDAMTVGIAVAAFEAENPTKFPTTPAGWKAALLGHKFVGGPFLQYWPNENARDYTIFVAGTATGRTTGDHVKAVNGDIIVTALLNGKRTYDATVNPVAACHNLRVLVLMAGAEVSDSSTDGIVGVACPTGTTCFGVTQNVSPSEGGVVAIDVSSPAHPTVTATEPIGLTTSLSAIACPTAAECVAVGSGLSNHGEVVPIVHGVVGSPVSDANKSYQAIACASATLCFAVGTDVAANKGVIVPVRPTTTPTFGTPLDVSSTRALQGAACPTTTSCYAVGDQLNASKVANGVVVPFGVSAGTPRPGKAQSVAGATELSAIECLGADACDATGLQSSSPDVGVLSGVSQGSAGMARKVPGTTSLYGIACVGTSLCYGLGTGASSTGEIVPLSATIGTRTSIRASANPVMPDVRVAYTAIVAPSPSAGFVAFTSNGKVIAGCGAVAVRNGVARCVVSFRRPGREVVRSSYSGDADQIGSTSKPVVETVAASTSRTLALLRGRPHDI